MENIYEQNLNFIPSLFQVSLKRHQVGSPLSGDYSFVGTTIYWWFYYSILIWVRFVFFSSVYNIIWFTYFRKARILLPHYRWCITVVVSFDLWFFYYGLFYMVRIAHPVASLLRMSLFLYLCGNASSSVHQWNHSIFVVAHYTIQWLLLLTPFSGSHFTETCFVSTRLAIWWYLCGMHMVHSIEWFANSETSHTVRHCVSMRQLAMASHLYYDSYFYCPSIITLSWDSVGIDISHGVCVYIYICIFSISVAILYCMISFSSGIININLSTLVSITNNNNDL